MATFEPGRGKGNTPPEAGLAQLPLDELREYLVARLSEHPSVGAPLDWVNREQPHDVVVRAARATDNGAFLSTLGSAVAQLLAETTPVSPATADRCFYLLCLVDELQLSPTKEAVIRHLMNRDHDGIPSSEKDLHRGAMAAAISLNLEEEPQVRSVLRADLRSKEYGLLAATGLAHINAETAAEALATVIAIWDGDPPLEERRRLASVLKRLAARWRKHGFLPLLVEQVAQASPQAVRLCEELAALAGVELPPACTTVAAASFGGTSSRPAYTAGAAMGSLPLPMTEGTVGEIPTSQELHDAALLMQRLGVEQRRRYARQLAEGVLQGVPPLMREELQRKGLHGLETFDSATRVPLNRENVFALTSDPEFWLVNAEAEGCAVLVGGLKKHLLVNKVEYRKWEIRSEAVTTSGTEPGSEPAPSPGSGAMKAVVLP